MRPQRNNKTQPTKRRQRVQNRSSLLSPTSHISSLSSGLVSTPLHTQSPSRYSTTSSFTKAYSPSTYTPRRVILQQPPLTLGERFHSFTTFPSRLSPNTSKQSTSISFPSLSSIPAMGTLAPFATHRQTRESSPILQPSRGLFSWFKKFGDNSIHVGTDPAGNKYYTYQVRGEHLPRRRVEYVPTEDGIPSPSQLHIFWESWLRGRRETPPTDEEISIYEQKMFIYHENVKRIEEADALLRQQEQERKKHHKHDLEPDMSTETFIHNLERKKNPPKEANFDVHENLKIN